MYLVAKTQSNISTYSGFFLDISKKTQGQKNSGRKKLKQIFQKTHAQYLKTQYFAN